MYEDVYEVPDDLLKEEIEFENKALECQEEYHGMLRKYQYLIMKESTVSFFNFVASTRSVASISSVASLGSGSMAPIDSVVPTGSVSLISLVAPLGSVVCIDSVAPTDSVVPN